MSDSVSSCPDVGVPAGASTTDTGGSGSGPSGGAAASGSAGANAAASAGANAAASGTAGANAGSGAPNLGGTSATTPFVWPADYDAAAMPMPSDGHHNAGTSCMSSSCHGAKVPFAFGGTVYRADGVTGAPNVEVGISTGALTVVAHSASNGNIWLPSSVGSIDFASAQIAIRNANGERVKPATAPRGSACNGGGCHGASLRLLEP